MCILSALLKVVGYYDLSVLSMSVMVLKKVWMGSPVGGCFFWILGIFLTLQSPLSRTMYLLSLLSTII